jgi:hypothetical protein
MPTDRCPMHWIAAPRAWAAMRHPPPPASALQGPTLHPRRHPVATAWAKQSRHQIARAAVASTGAERHALPAECASRRRARPRIVRSRSPRAPRPRDRRAAAATRESDPIRPSAVRESRRWLRVRRTTAPRAGRLPQPRVSRKERPSAPVPIAPMLPDSLRSRCLPGSHDREADRTGSRRVPQATRQRQPAVNGRSRAARGAREGIADDHPLRRLNSHSEKPTIASAGTR